MKRVLTLASLTLLILSSCSGTGKQPKEEAAEQLEEATKPIESLTRQDTVQILRQAFEIGFVEKKIPDWNLLDDTTNIILDVYGMDPELIPSLPGKTFIILNREQLQAKADKEGDFHCAYVTTPVIKGRTKVHIGIGSDWIKSKDSETIYLSGGGLYLEFKKVDGKWKGKCYGSWII